MSDVNSKNKSLDNSQAGFSIVEALIATAIITVGTLAALQALTYSVLYNAGNATRSQALAVLQQEAERLRAAKWTPTGTDPYPVPASGGCNDAPRFDQRDLTGGAKTPCTVDTPNGGKFLVSTWIDDNPFLQNPPGQPDIDATTRIKEITITVQLQAPSPGWQTAVPATLVFRRTKGN